MAVDDDVAEELAAVCSGDHPHAGHPTWSPLWEAWLCPNCRSYLTDAELRMTLAEGAKPARQQPGWPLQARLWPSGSNGTSGPWTAC